jgi:hypothetical protein
MKILFASEIKKYEPVKIMADNISCKTNNILNCEKKSDLSRSLYSLPPNLR